MKTYSINNNSFLSLDRIDDGFGYSSYSISVSVDLGHSEFKATNSDIHLLNLAEFVGELDKFILNRDLEPLLKGTYDTFLKIRGNATVVILDFNVGSAYCGVETFMHSAQGSFEFSQESLNLIIRDLKGFA